MSKTITVVGTEHRVKEVYEAVVKSQALREDQIDKTIDKTVETTQIHLGDDVTEKTRRKLRDVILGSTNVDVTFTRTDDQRLPRQTPA